MASVGNSTRFVDSGKFSKGRIFFQEENSDKESGCRYSGGIQIGRQPQ